MQFLKPILPKLSYLIIKILGIGILILLFYFKIIPLLLNVIPYSALVSSEKIKNQFLVLIFGYFTLSFLIIFYLLGINKEEKELQKRLSANPDDFIAREKLKQIEAKRDRYIDVIEPVLMIIFGAIIAFITYAVFTLIYRFSGL